MFPIGFLRLLVPPKKGHQINVVVDPFYLLRHDDTDKHIRTCLNCVYIDQHVDIFKRPPACSSHDFKQLSSKLLLTASNCYTAAHTHISVYIYIFVQPEVTY